jgi:acetylornithine deacetylase/succinyl-diaminopimelate desuccinylase-like protein
MSEPIDWGSVEREALFYLKDLLRIDTTNPPGNERPAADYLARILERENIPYRLLESEPGRASLVARLRGDGSRGPLMLSGHLDVVPADRERWRHDPFGGVEAEGCIWGRGAIDMKNMVAMSLIALLLLKRTGQRLTRDLIFTAVADEEAGSRKGAVFLAEKHAELVQTQYVLTEVGGHTLHVERARFYPIQVSEKGICWFEITAEGETGHGSMPHPHNAVVLLSRALAALGRARLPQHVTPIVADFVRALAQAAPFPRNKLMPLVLNPHLADRLLTQLERTNLDQAIALNAMLRNTVSPTMLSAGKKVNVIPSDARAELDGRTIPGQGVADFMTEVERVIGERLTIRILEQHDGTVFPSDTPLFSAICSTLARHDPGAIPIPYMIPGFTDSFAYAKLGAICYGFSPVRLGPDLNFSRMYHGHDERIPISGFLWGVRVLYELVRDFCAAG